MALNKVLKERENCTLVKCRIFTGRTHQIRVHMAGIGHPLLGDVLYGDGQNPVFDGLALYAGKNYAKGVLSAFTPLRRENRCFGKRRSPQEVGNTEVF